MAPNPSTAAIPREEYALYLLSYNAAKSGLCINYMLLTKNITKNMFTQLLGVLIFTGEKNLHNVNFPLKGVGTLYY